MTRKRALLMLAFALAVALVAGAMALGSTNQSALGAARNATERFTRVSAATASGYAQLADAKNVACIDLPGTGGMGIHYVNGRLVKDAVIDPRRPEALVYEPHGSSMRLAALEYIVFAKAWQKASPPALFGRTFDYVAAGNRYGLPAFWALHAWVWKPNPAGTVMAWNPRVSCH